MNCHMIFYGTKYIRFSSDWKLKVQSSKSNDGPEDTLVLLRDLAELTNRLQCNSRREVLMNILRVMVMPIGWKNLTQKLRLKELDEYIYICKRRTLHITGLNYITLFKMLNLLFSLKTWNRTFSLQIIPSALINNSKFKSNSEICSHFCCHKWDHNHCHYSAIN